MTYVTVEDANTYFDTRLGASTYWVSGAEKEAALTTAETVLGAVYDLSAAPNAAKAIYEEALFLLRDIAGIDARIGLQSQGVKQSNVVGETYGKDAMPPICAYAAALLDGYKLTTGAGAFHAVVVNHDNDLDQDEFDIDD